MVRADFHEDILPSKWFLQLNISHMTPCLNLAVEADGIIHSRVEPVLKHNWTKYFFLVVTNCTFLNTGEFIFKYIYIYYMYICNLACKYNSNPMPYSAVLLMC